MNKDGLIYVTVEKRLLKDSCFDCKDYDDDKQSCDKYIKNGGCCNDEDGEEQSNEAVMPPFPPFPRFPPYHRQLWL
jgi:hypothetical protein